MSPYFKANKIENLSEGNAVYDTPSHTKKVFTNMRRKGKEFSGKVTPLFDTVLIQQQAEVGEGSGQPTDPQNTSTSAQPSNEEPITVPSSSQAKKTHRPRKSKRATKISQSSGPISLVADETITKEREDRMERAVTTTSSLEAECQDTILGDAEAQTRFETASKQFNDPPLSRVNTLRSREDRLKLKELIDLCTKLSDRVLDLETTKTAQAKEIASLKKRVKNLERKRKSKTPGMNLFKIGTSRRRSLGEEDVSKQGRNLKQGKKNSIFEDSDFNEDLDAVMDEAIEHVYEADKDVEGDAEQVSAAAVEVPTSDAVNTAGTEVNTASALITTAGISVSTTKPITTASVNITTASTLMKMRSEKSKVRGVVMQEPSKTATRPTVPPQQHDPKDKGKAQMQDELEKDERLAREREEDANIAEWDDFQAMIDDDYKLAAKLHAQEQEELTIKERSKLFVELMDKRKKYFARLRAEEQRRKPLTKAQKKNQMYSFVPMDSEVMKGSKDRAEGSETRAEGSSKRAGEDLQQESTKKQKMDDDKEKEELKQCFEIVPDDGDDVTIDATPLSVKIPIVDYKIYQEGKKSFFQIIRADGKTQMYLTFSKMLKNFDREDLEVLWRIVKARFKKTKPVDYMDTFLLLTLKTMFEHHVEDSIWKNQQGLVKVLNWKLFDSCRVHCVTMQTIPYYSTYKAYTTSDV
ncbi:hypothetical protein Tco_0459113 [Tanacetum coccineum]